MSFKVLVHPKAKKKIDSLPSDKKEWIKNRLKEFSEDPFSFDIKKLFNAGKYPKYRLIIGIIE